MIIHDCNQGSKAWESLRIGIPTASNFDRIMTPGKKASSQAPAYMHQLLAERVIGRPLQSFTSKWMERGSELEQKVVDAYEFRNDVTTKVIGFVTNDAGTVGCSPDRFIEEHPEGMMEAKAPSPDVMISYLLAPAGKGIALDYKCQIYGELWVCEKDWNDITAYHPDLPEVQFRIGRDEEFIKELAAHVMSFSRQLEEKAEELRERGIIKPKPEPREPERIGELGINEQDKAWQTKGIHY